MKTKYKVTYNWLVGKYGEPVLRFKPHGAFSIQETVDELVPFECAVFKHYRTYSFVTCYRTRENDEWDWGADRFTVRELFRQQSEKNKLLELVFNGIPCFRSYSWPDHKKCDEIGCKQCTIDYLKTGDDAMKV